MIYAHALRLSSADCSENEADFTFRSLDRDFAAFSGAWPSCRAAARRDTIELASNERYPSGYPERLAKYRPNSAVPCRLRNLHRRSRLSLHRRVAIRGRYPGVYCTNSNGRYNGAGDAQCKYGSVSDRYHVWRCALVLRSFDSTIIQAHCRFWAVFLQPHTGLYRTRFSPLQFR